MSRDNNVIKIISKNEDNPLFKYLPPSDNDNLSLMYGYNLQDLLVYLEDYYLELRNKLGFASYITFGAELEFENSLNKQIKDQLAQNNLNGLWLFKSDSSLTNGGEITSPILTDIKYKWRQLNNVCAIVAKNATINDNCGGHIHVGAQVLGSKTESWLNFIKLWSVYENIIYRFVYGEFLGARTYITKYASPLAKDFWEDYNELKKSYYLEIKDILNTISHKRDQAINFYNVTDCNKEQTRNTIEFRCPNGTLDPVIWQNNVNLLVKLLLYAKSPRYNDDIVNKRQRQNKDKYSNWHLYSEIYLDQALEFCDLIFTNNFDKVYFLRQYLKSLQVATEKQHRVVEFTRKLK